MGNIFDRLQKPGPFEEISSPFPLFPVTNKNPRADANPPAGVTRPFLHTQRSRPSPNRATNPAINSEKNPATPDPRQNHRPLETIPAIIGSPIVPNPQTIPATTCPPNLSLSLHLPSPNSNHTSSKCNPPGGSAHQGQIARLCASNENTRRRAHTRGV